MQKQHSGGVSEIRFILVIMIPKKREKCKRKTCENHVQSVNFESGIFIESYRGDEMKRSSGMRYARNGIGRAVARGFCLAASVLALLALGGKVGTEIAAVSRGEITAAQMFVELGEWLQGE